MEKPYIIYPISYISYILCILYNLVSYSSWLYAMGKTVWKKWKKRYFVLVQVSQYTFAICRCFIILLLFVTLSNFSFSFTLHFVLVQISYLTFSASRRRSQTRRTCYSWTATLLITSNRLGVSQRYAIDPIF